MNRIERIKDMHPPLKVEYLGLLLYSKFTLNSNGKKSKLVINSFALYPAIYLNTKYLVFFNL